VHDDRPVHHVHAARVRDLDVAVDSQRNLHRFAQGQAPPIDPGAIGERESVKWTSTAHAFSLLRVSMQMNQGTIVVQ
jgi:hypothetical protein